MAGMTLKPNSEIKGDIFGVRFVRRGEHDPHICLQLLIEDDEHWFEIGSSFSACWIDDLIEQLTEAKRRVSRCTKDKEGGHLFQG
jgi:hypothetical protein